MSAPRRLAHAVLEIRCVLDHDPDGVGWAGRWRVSHRRSPRVCSQSRRTAECLTRPRAPFREVANIPVLHPRGGGIYAASATEGHFTPRSTVSMCRAEGERSTGPRAWTLWTCEQKSGAPGRARLVKVPMRAVRSRLHRKHDGCIIRSIPCGLDLAVGWVCLRCVPQRLSPVANTYVR